MTRIATTATANSAPQGKTNGNGHAHVQRPAYEWEALPSELRTQGRFVLYRNKPEAGKKDRKVPYQAKNPSALAKVNDADTWATYKLARAQFGPGHFDGLNFVTCPEFTAVDLDHCVTDGRISAEATAIMTALPETYWEYSPSRTGLHGIFRSSGIKTLAGTSAGQPVEVYAGGHFMSVTGWVVNDAPIAGLKPEHVEPYRVKKETASVSSGGTDEPIYAGQRNSLLLSMAGAMRRQGMSVEAMGQALWQTNLERCRPPLDEKRITKILASISKYSAADLLLGERQDVGNADRLLSYGQGHYRYVAAKKRWVVYDGTRWPVEDDEHETIRSEAHDMVRAFARQAVDVNKEDYIKFAAESLNSARISNMLREAQSKATLAMDELDRDTLLINFLNGTLDARTGKLRKHSAEDYITALVPHDYNPEAQCPRWEEFISAAFGDQQDMVEFFQRCVGYSLTADTSEKKIFLVHGEKDTSKTTAMTVIREVLGGRQGGYADVIRVDTLMADRKNNKMDNNANDDLADMRGRRFIMTSETAQAQHLREELVKLLTQGQGVLKAAKKYEHMFSFRESWKIWMDCNHLPIIKGTDDAIWDRLVVFGFEHRIPEDQQIKNLSAQLIEEEAEGILAWMTRGLAAWMKSRLVLPAVMLEQREEWREESDDMGQWLEESCVKAKTARASSSTLYASYKEWRKHNGFWEESAVVFARKMKEHGFDKKETGNAKVPTWFGVGLKSL